MISGVDYCCHPSNSKCFGGSQNACKLAVMTIAWKYITLMPISLYELLIRIITKRHILLISLLFHWGQVTNICLRKHTHVGSDSGLSPGRQQAIIQTSAGILLNGPLGTNLEGWPAMNTKCLVLLPFLPDLILRSTENRSHGSPVLVPPETQ